VEHKFCIVLRNGHKITSPFDISALSLELPYLLPPCRRHLPPVLARSSIKKARKRTTIPALLFNQNEPIQTQSERQTGKLSRAHSLSIVECRFSRLQRAILTPPWYMVFPTRKNQEISIGRIFLCLVKPWTHQRLSTNY